jgi:hypothetical protein
VDRPTWESVVVEVAFNANRTPKEILLHPISLGFGEFKSTTRPASSCCARDFQTDHRTCRDLIRAGLEQVEFRDGRGVVELSHNGVE